MRSKEDILEQIKIKKARYELYLKAECDILAHSQSYTTGSSQMARASLNEVREEIKNIENEIIELENELASGGKRKSFRVIPRDL